MRPTAGRGRWRRAFSTLPHARIEHQRRRAGGRAVVEARRARLRAADADRAPLGRACRACARRRARPGRARAAASRPARARSSTRQPVGAGDAARAASRPARASRRSARTRRVGRRAGRPRRARPRRSPRAARAPRRARPRGARIGCGQQLGARRASHDLVDRQQALDVAPPALAPGVDEVERRTAAEPVPVRRAARSGPSGTSRDHNRIIRRQPVTQRMTGNVGFCRGVRVPVGCRRRMSV